MKKAKKFLTFALVMVLTIVATVGITVAFLTDTDDEVNTFTLGNVEIELVEQQRKVDDDGNFTDTLEDFVNDKVLLPIVGSAQAGDGYPTAANYVDKIVDVENTGIQDAYVRVLMAFPADMDAEQASDMMMHWNVLGTMTKWTLEETDQKNVEIEGRKYNIYCFTYQDVLPAGKTTEEHALIGVYIDSRVDATAERDVEGKIISITYSMKNSAGDEITSIKYTDVDGNGFIDGPQIHVFAQAIQAAGFATAEAAFEASDFTLNPWAPVQ